MRLWHYKLLPFLPNSQLVAQWRELNSIYGKPINHILINYVKKYPKENLLYYSILVVNELNERGMQTRMENFENYFDCCDFGRSFKFNDGDNPFPNHHTDRYLKQCFYNLQEKYDRGQVDFDKERYTRLEEFIRNEIQTKGLC